MDILLKGKTFNFFIDEIFLSNALKEDKKEAPNNNIKEHILFGAVLIPNINSAYFPPMHLRKILFSPEYLSQKCYRSYWEKFKELPSPDNYDFRGGIVEGNYYEIPSKLFSGQTLPKVLTQDFHDFFQEYKFTSPFVDKMEEYDNILNPEQGLTSLDVTQKSVDKDELVVYCFNVGQGDSILVIFPNKSVYIIDTNIYSGKSLDTYISIVKSILSNNDLPVNKIKAMIITHKHLDHLRGAAKLIESGEFQFKHFIINFDYSHKTNVVYELLDVVKQGIANNS